MKIFEDISVVVEKVKKGEVVIVFDEQREHEADLVVSAELLTPQHINFMITWGRGLVCVPLTVEKLQTLEIKLLSSTDPLGTKWCMSLDAASGVTTGISAFDRAFTIRRLVDQKSVATDFTRPGHVFPLLASAGGLKERQGHAEASIELMKFAGLAPMAVICEIIRDDGSMAELEDLVKFSKKHELVMCTIDQLVKYKV